MSSVQESFLSYLKSSWSPFAEQPIINPLYVIPVLSVLALCLLVYAIGVRSSSAVPPTLALLRDDHKHVQKKLQSNKKPNNKTKSKPVEKHNENGHVGSANKPQAVVKPLKQEKKTASVTQEVVKKPKVSSDEIEDLSSGDWVTVVSDRAKKALKAKQTPVSEDKPLKEDVIPPTNTSKKDEKKGKKQEKKQADSLNKKSKREINESTQSPLTESKEQASKKVEQKSAPPAPVAAIEVLDWTAEEPEEFKKEDISKAQKKKASKNSKEAVKKLESQISRESIVLPPPQPQASQAPIITLDDKPAPKDRITNEILAQYDSAPINKKDAKKSNNKKADNNKVPKEQTPKKADSSTSTSKAKAAPVPKDKPQENKKQAAPKKVSPATNKTEQPAKVEAKVVEPPPSLAASSGASGSTDVTDATESDPSEGEFKVVQKKRKPRRE